MSAPAQGPRTMSAEQAIAAIEAAYKPHFPNLRVRVKSGGAILVRSGPGMARMIGSVHECPRSGPDSSLTRGQWLAKGADAIIAFLPKRLAWDAESEERRQAYKAKEALRASAPDLLAERDSLREALAAERASHAATLAALEALVTVDAESVPREHPMRDAWSDRMYAAFQSARAAIAQAKGGRS